MCLLHRIREYKRLLSVLLCDVFSSAVTNNRILPSTPTSRLPPTVACDCLITTHVSINLSSRYDHIENCTQGTRVHRILDHICIRYVIEVDATRVLYVIYIQLGNH